MPDGEPTRRQGFARRPPIVSLSVKYMKSKSFKICVLGEFAVGKTSTVARCVSNTFSEVYLTTVGVKVDSKSLSLSADQEVRLVLWDIAGSNTLDQVRTNYILGAHALLLVADGTREPTVATALGLRDQAQLILDRDLPSVLMLNKADLVGEWSVSHGRIRDVEHALPIISASAKTGEGVEEALRELAKALMP